MFDVLLNITYLAAIAMSLYSAVWLLLKADRNRTVCAFIACQLLIVVWCVPQLFLGFVQSREGLYTAYAVSYVGICFIGPAWLVFALRYGGKPIPKPAWWREWPRWRGISADTGCALCTSP